MIAFHRSISGFLSDGLPTRPEEHETLAVARRRRKKKSHWNGVDHFISPRVPSMHDGRGYRGKQHAVLSTGGAAGAYLYYPFAIQNFDLLSRCLKSFVTCIMHPQAQKDPLFLFLLVEAGHHPDRIQMGEYDWCWWTAVVRN